MPPRYAGLPAAVKEALSKPYTREQTAIASKAIHAALYGHTPSWRKKGWKSPFNNWRFARSRLNPQRYIDRRLLETGQLKGEPRERSTSGAKPEQQSRSIGASAIPRRPTSLTSPQKLHGRVRSYSTHASSRLATSNEAVDLATPVEESGVLASELEQDDSEDIVEASQGSNEPDEVPPNTEGVVTRVVLQPGDWVQVRLFNKSTGLIYLRDWAESRARGRRALFHGMQNSLVAARYDDIIAHIPSVVPEKIANKATRMLRLSHDKYLENLADLGVTAPSEATIEGLEMTEDEQEMMWDRYGLAIGTTAWKEANVAKLRCIQALKDISLKQESLRKDILQKGIRQLYEHLNSGAKPQESLTVEQAYNLIYKREKDRKGKVTAMENLARAQRMLAIQNILFDMPEHFIADPVNFVTSATFKVRRPKEVWALKVVREWVRNDTKEIRDFYGKVRYLQQKLPGDRLHSLEAACEDKKLSHEPVEGASEWSRSDRITIQFLKSFLHMRRRLQINPYEATTSLIVKALDRNVAEDKSLLRVAGDIPTSLIGRPAVLRLLQDIGILREWENHNVHDADLDLQKWNEELAASAQETASSGLHDTQPVDGLDPIRREFGNLPVYTIDDASASELDDGISIQQASVKDSLGRPTTWVHVHIADPTSSIRPSDVVAIQAQKRQSSFYLPEMTWPMIPFELIKASRWSLGDTDEQRVLTFSARLDTDGEVLEREVQASVVRNVKRITYDLVDQVLRGEKSKFEPESTQSARYSLAWPYHLLSNTGRAFREPDAIVDSDKQSLRDLQRIGRSLLRKRVATNAVTWASGATRASSAKLIMHTRPLLPEFSVPAGPQIPTAVPALELVLPSQSTSSSKPSDDSSPAQDLVMEFMILAGRIASSHLSERGIPMAYRGQVAPIGYKNSVAELMKLRDPDNGQVNVAEVHKRNIQFQPAYLSTVPVDHWPLGISAESGGYVRTTSPLRRFSDLVAHWQIKSTLVPASSRASSTPPFSDQDIQSMIGRIDSIDRQRKRMERRSITFWRLFTIRQKLQQVRTDPASDPAAAALLLDGLTATIGQARLDLVSMTRVTQVTIPELGITAVLLLPAKQVLSFGSSHKVEIAGVILDEFSKLFVKLK